MPDPLRPNPEMMVIGDSLAQGCRNMTVNAAYCSQSWGARVAAMQEWKFIPPNFPHEVLFDLEREIRNLDTLGLSLDNLKFSTLISRMIDNLNFWLKFRGSPNYTCFDNLGLSGAMIRDLYDRTSNSCTREIQELTSGPGGPIGALCDSLSDLHMAINARYTLNPSQDPAYGDYSQLDWVEKRRPKVLCVQIGHNHGLFEVGFSAKDDGHDDCVTQGDYWDQWEALTARLATLPAAVGTILILLFPKVGATASLMPHSQTRVNGYADYYQPVFSIHAQTLTGRRVCEIDLLIRKINERMKDIMLQAQKKANPALVSRIRFIDVYELIDELDYKNTLDPARKVPVLNGAIDNCYLHGNLEFLNHSSFPLRAGGFFSADGMHPSGCGYVTLAERISKILGLNANVPGLMDQAFNEDNLLSRYPDELDKLVFVLSLLRKCMLTGDFDHSPARPLSDDSHLVDQLNAMATLFKAR